ncbi:MAG: hypothetical protein SGJ02_10075 [bacterium]|nr:hypothetical protein [bacterium]
MFDPKIKVSKHLLDKLKVASEIIGCSSVDEFVERTLAAEADRVIASTGKRTAATDKEVEEITNQLKGLGYLE